MLTRSAASSRTSKTGKPSTFTAARFKLTINRGVASVALRSLAIAAECLTIRREQEEVLAIFTRIHKDTGWRIGFIPKDLTERWGWDISDPSPQLPTMADPLSHLSPQATNGGVLSSARNQQSPYQFDQYGEMQQRLQAQQQQQQQAQAHAQAQAQAVYQQQQQQAQLSSPHGNTTAPAPTPPRKQPPQGIVNPMFAMADFGMPKHPYQEYYVAPSHNASHQLQGQGLGLGAYPLHQGGFSYQ